MGNLVSFYSWSTDQKFFKFCKCFDNPFPSLLSQSLKIHCKTKERCIRSGLSRVFNSNLVTSLLYDVIYPPLVISINCTLVIIHLACWFNYIFYYGLNAKYVQFNWSKKRAYLWYFQLLQCKCRWNVKCKKLGGK